MKSISMPKAKLGKWVSFQTGKLNSNAAKPNGRYPFFTCAQETFKTDTYSFDTECVLLGGNNANGIYPIKYFNGKFDAYQRTYIIHPLNKSYLNTRYLYYVLQLKLELLKSISTGAATKFLTLTILNDIEIEIPALETQKKVVSILSGYDDLIENNSRRIYTLDKMARMLYQEWFVKFRFPGYEQTKFVESPIGMIPEGWQVIGIGQVADVKHGYAFKGEFFSEEPTNDILLTPGNFCIGGGFKTDKLKYYNGFMPNEYVLKVGELIVTMTDLSKLGDTLGYPAFIPLSKKYNFLHNQRIGRIVFLDEKVGKNFLYYTFCSESYRHHILATATGTTVKHTAPERIKAFKTILPLQDFVDNFEMMVGIIHSQIQCLSEKNQILQQTRDLLLPKLISGQIDVSGLDIQM